MRTNLARVILESWTPRQLGPALWIEARRAGTLFQSNAGTNAAAVNSDVIGYARDLSGNGFDMTSAADDTTRPTLQGVGVGLFPYISFDGSNDILRRTAALGSYAAGSCSVFACLRSNSNATSSIVFAEGDSASNNSVYALLGTNSATATTESGFIRDSTNTTILSSATAAQTNVFNAADHVFGIVDGGASVTPYLDGVAGTAVSAARGGLTLTQDRTALGGLQRAAAGSFWAGRIYGIVVVNRVLTSQERSKLTTYLGKLAGLTL